MGIYVNTGDTALDAMLRDYAGLWEKYCVNICVCSDTTLLSGDFSEGAGCIVVVKNSAWLNSTEAETYFETHAASTWIQYPVVYRELDEKFRGFVARGDIKDSSGCAEISQVQFDSKRNAVAVGNTEILLTPIEYALFKVLYANNGKTVARETLIQNVWKNEISGNRCDVHMASLRRKLTDVFGNGSLTSVRGVGYVFRW